MCHHCNNLTPTQQTMLHTLASVGTKALRRTKQNLLNAQKLYFALGHMETAALYEEVVARIDACEQLLHRGYVE